MTSHRWLGLGLAVMTMTLSAQQSRPAFEVVSIKPASNQPTTMRATSGDFYRASTSVMSLISFAYGVSGAQLSCVPDWMIRQRYEVIAKTDGTASPQQSRLMVQSLLEDRFKLVVREERRAVSYQSLRLRSRDGRVGPKLEKCDPRNRPFPNGFRMPAGAFPAPVYGGCVPLSELVNIISSRLNTVVVDDTGLEGFWTFLAWYADPSATSPSDLPSSLPAALEDELGLKLVSAKAPMKVLIIDSVREPTEN